MTRRKAALVAAAAAGLSAVPGAAQPPPAEQAVVWRGRYLVEIGGCNDCHTQGFGLAGGKVPEAEWLKGSPLGWRGPWGTTYAVNLRLLVARLSEDGWRSLLRTMQPKPPMPWWALQWMTPEDQRALYVYIRHLGPAGAEAPADLPPGAAPPPPFVSFPMPPGAKKPPG